MPSGWNIHWPIKFRWPTFPGSLIANPSNSFAEKWDIRIVFCKYPHTFIPALFLSVLIIIKPLEPMRVMSIFFSCLQPVWKVAFISNFIGILLVFNIVHHNNHQKLPSSLVFLRKFPQYSWGNYSELRNTQALINDKNNWLICRCSHNIFALLFLGRQLAGFTSPTACLILWIHISWNTWCYCSFFKNVFFPLD